MSMHTYVGARYVPNFMGTYDNTQQYDALDVVDNGMGTSYIAKQTVPPNTPLTNTSYWALFGSTSAAIIALQNDMIAAQNDIGNLQTDMTNAQNDINALKSQRNNILIIGNSFVNRGVADEIAALFNNYYTKTEGGLGFVAYTGHSNTFEQLVANASSDPLIDNDSITDILFVSAAGDGRAITELGAVAYTTALETNLSAIMARIGTDFTNCNRVMVTLADSRAIPYFADAKYSSIFETHRIFTRVMDNHEFDYIGWSGWNAFLDSSCFEADNLHPNTKGARVIGNFIKDSYLGHVEYMKKSNKATCSYNYTASGSGTVICELLPDMCNLQVRDISVTSGAAVTVGLNDIFLSTAAVPIPLPAPSYYDKDVYVDILVPTTGQKQDYLHLLLTSDSNGVAELAVKSVPTATTALANKLCVPLLTSFMYF